MHFPAGPAVSWRRIPLNNGESQYENLNDGPGRPRGPAVGLPSGGAAGRLDGPSRLAACAHGSGPGAGRRVHRDGRTAGPAEPGGRARRWRHARVDPLPERSPGDPARDRLPVAPGQAVPWWDDRCQDQACRNGGTPGRHGRAPGTKRPRGTGRSFREGGDALHVIPGISGCWSPGMEQAWA